MYSSIRSQCDAEKCVCLGCSSWQICEKMTLCMWQGQCIFNFSFFLLSNLNGPCHCLSRAPFRYFSSHSRDHGIKSVPPSSVSRTSALRRSNTKWCDQCFVFLFRHNDVDTYDDNGYNNSLALYLHYLSLIPMLFIVLLARGMSDHSVISGFR